MDTNFLLENLYYDLKKKSEEENKYLKENDEIDESYIDEIILEKRIIRDKIEKKEVEGYIFIESEKIEIQNIIRTIMEIEEENKIMYEEKLNRINQELQSLYQERKLKNSYFNAGQDPQYFDRKK